jgi:hypothetical protein
LGGSPLEASQGRLEVSQRNRLQDPISNTISTKWTGGVAQVVEHLLCKCEALSSNPNHAHTHTHTHTILLLIINYVKLLLKY